MSSFTYVAKKNKVQPADVAGAEDGAAAGSAPSTVVSGYSPRLRGAAATPGAPAGPPPRGLFEVLKFGGSSMGSAARIAKVLDTIDRACREHPDKRFAVVVSAGGSTTDLLLTAADYASEGEQDRALAVLDQISSNQLSNAFEANSVPSELPPRPSPGAGAAGSTAAGGEEMEIMTLDDDSCRVVPTASKKRKRQPASDSQSQQPLMPRDFVPRIRRTLQPLRKIMEGMALLRERTPQGLDYALSFGERISAITLTYLLNARGVGAVFVDAREVAGGWVRTNAHFGAATVDWATTRSNVESLWKGWGARVSVHTGFIGSSADGRTTTLGRNGSDYTATLLGGALKAKTVIINTDVPGVMTADPRIVAGARPVSHLSYHEALELAVYGAKLFHGRTFFPLIQTNVPMLIRNTCAKDLHAGTLISSVKSTDTNTTQGAAMGRPTCVTSLENCAMIEVSLMHQGASRNPKLGQIMSTTLADVAATVYLESQAAHGHSCVFVVPMSETEAVVAALTKSLATAISEGTVAEPTIVSPVTMLSVVLEDMREHPDVASCVNGTLASLGIKVLAVSMGTRSYSCVVSGGETTVRAVRGVHNAFNLSEQHCSLFIVGASQCHYGSSTTAISLVEVIRAQSARLQRELNLHLNLVGVMCVGSSGKTHLLTSEKKGRVIDCDSAISILSQGALATPRSSDNEVNEGTIHDSGSTCSETYSNVLRFLKTCQNPIIVDCSGNEAHCRGLYDDAFREGVDLVVGNAMSICALSQESPVLKYLQHKSKGGTARGSSLVRYDTTVGGALPVLSCIRSFRRSGDSLLRIQSALSGSVNAIACICSDATLGSESGSNKMSLSRAVQEAMESKYMEVDPRRDLLGIDFAHKVVVLAHEVGFDLSVEDVEITPFVPESVTGPALDLQRRGAPTKEETEIFLSALKSYDSAFEEKVREMCSGGKSLRYVADLEFDYDAQRVTASIKPVAVSRDHALYWLKGKEVFVALTTSLLPAALVLSGAGQGGREGASGLLGDIIRVAQRFKVNMH